ncbi:MAG: hypothetical protein ABI267_02735 [Ginsengibacter sp.]
MRYAVLFSIILFVIFSSCKKDKFDSKPSLTFKSVNTKVLTNGQQIQFTLSFTDGEGDLAGSMYIEKYEPTCVGSSFAETDSIPAFPTSKNEKGDFLVTYPYVNIAPQCQRNDTAIFRFAIKDKANHVSDTVSSPPIVIIYQ